MAPASLLVSRRHIFHLPDDFGDLRGSDRGFRDIAGDLVGHRMLFLDGAGDGGRGFLNAADRLRDGANGFGGALRGGPDLMDLSGDFFGGARGLVGQGFHLAGDHGETFSGIPGPGRFDGGVERQQIGLAGDILDQAEHLADFGGGGIQGADRFIGAFGQSHRFRGNVAGDGGLAG